MITIASAEGNTTDSRSKAVFFIVEPNGKQLTTIAKLLETGQLRPFVSAVEIGTDLPGRLSANIAMLAKGAGILVHDLDVRTTAEVDASHFGATSAAALRSPPSQELSHFLCLICRQRALTAS